MFCMARRRFELKGWPNSPKKMHKSRYIGDGHPTFNRNPYNGYINPYYWVDDHPLLYGNNGSLDPGTHKKMYKYVDMSSWNWLGFLEKHVYTFIHHHLVPIIMYIDHIHDYRYQVIGINGRYIFSKDLKDSWNSCLGCIPQQHPHVILIMFNPVYINMSPKVLDD